MIGSHIKEVEFARGAARRVLYDVALYRFAYEIC